MYINYNMNLNIFLICFVLFTACERKISETDLLHKKNPVGTYGTSIIEGEVFDVNKLLSESNSFVDKTVKVKGKVVDVCPLRGCWVEIKDDNLDEKIRIKVTDGEIVFPLSSIGKDIIAVGEFSKLILTEKQAKDWKIHLAFEKGIQLDTTNITLTGKDYYEFRIFSNSAQIF